MLPGRINLNRGDLDVLASETRVNILKKLDFRRMTVSELSGELGLSKPTVLDHLSRLLDVDLIEKKDDGRKWVYYELTPRGKEILHPEERTKIIILLSSTVVALAGGILSIYFYVKSTLLPEEGFPPLEGGSPGPRHLFLGLILLSFGIILLYSTLRMKDRFS